MAVMEDVSDAELQSIENGSRVSVQKNKSNDIEDEKLINMVKDIKEGKIPSTNLVPNTTNIPKIIEPDMMKYDSPMEVLTTNIQGSNYWKINGMPSKGKFYKSGDILGRPLKVLEVKKISSMNEDNGDFILNDIIKKTVTGIQLEEMYIADKLFIIFWLRANSYKESGYVIPFECNRCGKSSEYHFEIDNLEVSEISDNFSPDADYTLPCGEVIRYDYLKVKDELYIDRFKELNRNVIGDIDVELLAMAQMIKSINGKVMTLLQKYYWITELSPGDYSYIKTIIEKNGMGIKPYVNVTCKECGGTAVVAVSFRDDFFTPQYKAE